MSVGGYEKLWPIPSNLKGNVNMQDCVPTVERPEKALILTPSWPWGYVQKESKS